ncbi:MAG: hypothetical protein RIR70_2266, partial [Pseudomonadota bacterium]
MQISDTQRDLALMENLFGEGASMVAAPARTQMASHSANTSRPRFRQVSSWAGDAAKRMMAHASRVSLVLGGVSHELRWKSILSALPDCDVFHLTLGEHRFQIEVEQIDRLLRVPAEWWENSPGALRAGLLADFIRDSISVSEVSVIHLGTSRHMDDAVMPCELAFCLVSHAPGMPNEYRGRLRFETSPAAVALVGAWERCTPIGQRRVPDIALPVS